MVCIITLTSEMFSFFSISFSAFVGLCFLGMGNLSLSLGSSFFAHASPRVLSP